MLLKHLGDAEVLDLPVFVVEIVKHVVLRLHEETRNVIVEFVVFSEVDHLLLTDWQRVDLLEELLFIRVVEGLEIAEEDQTARSFLLEDYLVYLACVVVVLARGVLQVHLRRAFTQPRRKVRRGGGGGTSLPIHANR